VTDTFAPNKLIPPEEGYPVDVPVKLSLSDLGKYWGSGCSFGLQIDVIYEDVLKKDRPQHFLYSIECTPTRCEATEMSNHHETEVIREIGSKPTKNPI
jgi:hypothetical protein